MKVWVTKFWDTKGIYEANVKTPAGDGRRTFTVQYGDLIRMNPIPLMLGVTAFQRPEDAVVRVRELRTKKIQSLKRKIAKLEKMKI